MLKIKVVQKSGKYSEQELIEIMKKLRAPDGCPWDIEQTHNSIRKDLLEEAYEVADAIDKNDDTALCEELGDLLLQVVFHSVIAEEEGSFDYSDVVDGIAKKLVLRHPHVFGEIKADNSAEVLDLWDNIKKEEKHQTSATDTLKSVPEAFPALMRSAKVQKRAYKAGLDLGNPILSGKVADLAGKLNCAVQNEDNRSASELYGELLFALAGMQRFLGTDAEEALNAKTADFIARFEKAEQKAADKNILINEAFLND